MPTGFGADLRHVFQSLRRSPGFTLIAIVTLALGIGANTAAFSIVNGLLLRPLPYPNSEELSRIYRTTAQNPRGALSPADFTDLVREQSAYGRFAAYGLLDMNLSAPGQPADVLTGLRVSAGLFSVLGAPLELGRDFRADEERAGNHRVVILNYRTWQKRFGADPAILGRIVRINGEPHEIVGVLAREINDWRHLGPSEIFRPLGLSEAELADRGAGWLRVIGRRSSEVSAQEADRFVTAFGKRLAAEFPAVHAGSGWRSLLIHDAVVPENAKGMTLMIVGLSGFVLLIACSNLANLLLARTMSRTREFAVRAALGASRARLLRPLLLESLTLSLVGAIGAIQGALLSNRWLNSMTLESGADPVFGLDWRVLSWAFAASLFAALTFGLAPALFALRVNLNSTLKSGSRGTTGGRAQHRFRQFLIAGQFALAMVLLAGAAIFVRGLYDWNNRTFGWDGTHLVSGTVLLPETGYPGEEEITAFQQRALEQLGALPGVRSASISHAMPFLGLADVRRFLVAGREVPPSGQEPVASTNAVSPAYFETVGTSLLSGRTFRASDTRFAPPVFIINQSMARGLFAGQDPLGQRIARVRDGSPEWGEIVGIATDVFPVSSDRLTVTYQVYRPVAQEPRLVQQIAVRTDGRDPAAMLSRIRTTVMAIDQNLPIRQLETADVSVTRAGNYQRIIATILKFLAGIGLALACLGIYGVVARTTAQRRGEFGIRMALGAARTDITRLVLGAGTKLALIGSAVGIAGAIGTSRLLVAAFPGLELSTLPVLAAVTGVLAVVSQLASYWPARIASRTSPTEALRAE